MTDGSWFDDKPRWSPDGRTLYFVSNRDGHPEVWGRHFDSLTGRPVGELFRVTAFAGGPEFLSPHFTQMDMVVSERRLFLPMARAAGQIWLLEHVEE